MPIGNAGGDHSLIALFTQAHWVVQIVIILLLLASFWSWAVIIDKALSFRRARKRGEAFEADFWSGRPLDELFDSMAERPESATGRVFAAGMREWRRSFETGGGVIPGAQERIEKSMTVAIERELMAQERGLGVLASIGSISPFVGLFGTVWGIKNSFESIAASQNTSLAVVAPGIAEALVATALGLLAAIPAVAAYNWLSDRQNRLAIRLEGFADEFATLLSRQLERRAN